MNKGPLLAASAAVLFALSHVAPASAGKGIKCSGINSCKGTSACKTASSSCKGKNSCKGQGWTEVSSEDECTSRGGKIKG